MRLIDADAIPYTMLYKENWTGCTGIEKLGVWKDTIDAMPTIEERKNGNRVGIDDKPCETFECDVCGFVLGDWIEGAFYNYCPNCGADMRGI